MPDSLSALSTRELWDEAVRIVDGRHGYTVEFAPDPDTHRAEYDSEYRRLRRSEIKAMRDA